MVRNLHVFFIESNFYKYLLTIPIHYFYIFLLVVVNKEEHIVSSWLFITININAYVQWYV